MPNEQRCTPADGGGGRRSPSDGGGKPWQTTDLVPYDPMRDPLAPLMPAERVGSTPAPPREATSQRPSGDRFVVCGGCFQVRGSRDGRRQLCGCATEAEREACTEAAHRRSGSRWTRLVELCRCCGAEAVAASHTFAHWFCDACLARAAEVNRACGSCVIPVGWHSIVNGVFVHPNRRKQLPDLGAFADQLNAFFRESGDTWHWGLHVIARHWRVAGLPAGAEVPLERYLEAVSALRVDKAALFEELRTARGVPDDWRSFADIPLALVWHTHADGSLEAFEQILWAFADPEDGGLEPDGVGLRLLARKGSGRPCAWAVVIDEEADLPDPVLASGTSPTLGEAKAACEAAALRLIGEQERRLNR